MSESDSESEFYESGGFQFNSAAVLVPKKGWELTAFSGGW